MEHIVTEEDIIRIKRYAKNMQIVKGRHWNLFENPLRIDSTKVGLDITRDWERRTKRASLIYIVLNMASLIAKVSADFLFLEPLDISVKRVGENKDQESEAIQNLQDELVTIMDRNQMRIALYESALTNAARGDSIWKVNAVDGEAEIIEMDPELWMPVTGRNRREYVEHNFLTPILIGDDVFVIIENHKVGEITNTLHRVKQGAHGKGTAHVNASSTIEDSVSEEMARTLLKDNTFTETVKTKLEFIPVVHIPNIRFQSDIFGLSDFDDLDTIFAELNIRVSQAANILDKHADPKMFGPKLLDDNAEVSSSDLEYIEITDSDVKPQYITWESALEHSNAQITLMVDMALMLSETSKAAFGMTDGGTVESGAALKVKLIRTLAKIARKRLYYDPGIKRLLEYSLIIEQTATFNDVEIEIKWPSGLPEFLAEAVKVELDKFGSGVQSLDTTIGNLNGEWTKEEIEAEIAKINDDGDAGSRMTVGNIPEQNPEDAEDVVDGDGVGAVADLIARGNLG